MTAALALGVTAVVAAASAIGVYLFAERHRAQSLAAERAAARLQSELIRTALEHQMLENDRVLIGAMVETFGRDPKIRRVLILDRDGRIRFASEPPADGAPLHPRSPTCRVCHDRPPASRAHSAVVEAEGGAVLRSVLPIENRPACHRCHAAEHRINGVLIVDAATEATQARVASDVTWFALESGAVALGLLAAIALLVRLVVVRRLRRFEEAARAIVAGDLARRIPVDGNDTLAWLAREFNEIAAAADRLLAEVRQQRERLETVINGVDDGIVVLDRELRVVAANDAFLRRVGSPRASVVGRRCREVATELCSSATCAGEVCVRGAGRHSSVVARPGPDGDRRFEEVRSSPLAGPDGKTAFVVEVWRDITERRAAEARLAESDRLASLGMLASGFSHELNTPLGTVLACVESILRTVAEPEPGGAAGREAVADSARIAREQLLRCRGITQHFLRLSRGQQAEAEIVDVGAVAAAVVRLAEPTARERGVALAAEPVAAPANVRAAPAPLEQVLLNLVLNAIQACGPGGHVRVRVRADGGVRVEVSDDGPGIAPENRERIFEPFFSLRPGGTGLGLFLSLEAVRSWGAELTVDSAPGRGSTFAVAFADAQAGAAARDRGPRPEPPSAGKGEA